MLRSTAPLERVLLNLCNKLWVFVFVIVIAWLNRRATVPPHWCSVCCSTSHCYAAVRLSLFAWWPLAVWLLLLLRLNVEICLLCGAHALKATQQRRQTICSFEISWTVLSGWLKFLYLQHFTFWSTGCAKIANRGVSFFWMSLHLIVIFYLLFSFSSFI